MAEDSPCPGLERFSHVTTGTKTRELLGSGIFHVRFSVHIGLWVKPQRGKQWTRRAVMQTKFDIPGPFSVTCLAWQALSGQHGVVKSPAPHPHALLPFSLTCVGRPRLEYKLLVCAACVLKWLSLYSRAQAAWAWSAYSLLPPGQTSSQTKPTPITIASRCTRLTRPLTAKPARCSSGGSLQPFSPQPPWPPGHSAELPCDTMAPDLPL